MASSTTEPTYVQTTHTHTHILMIAGDMGVIVWMDGRMVAATLNSKCASV